MTGDVLEIYGRVVQRLTAPEGPFALEPITIRGRELRAYAGAPDSIIDILVEAEQRFAARDFVIEGDERHTYGDIFAASRRLAATLQDDHGIGVGDRVAIVMRNRPEWFVAFSAVARIGAVAVLLNSRGAPQELAAALTDVPCALVLADEERAERLAAGSVTPPVLAGDALAAAFAEGRREAADATVARDAPAIVLFTSGTTGRPKGAVLTHRNLTNMARNLAFLTASTTELNAELYGIPLETLRSMIPVPAVMLVFPMFHISGITTLFSSLETGGKIITMRRWRPEDALRIIAEHKVTMLSGPPLVISDVLDQPGAAETLTTINAVGIGGQATPRNLIERLSQTLPRAAQSAGWGMTEVSGSVSAAAGPLFMLRRDSCGVVSPVIDLRVIDEEGRTLAPGETGEILVGGPLVMDGYFNADDANEKVFADGWLRTGDIGFVDADGFVHLVDRKKDMVISAGENIYCAEVERVLCGDPGIVEAALFGIPDERLGERAIAAVRLRDGVSRTADEIKAYVRQHLADYKVPADVALDLGAFPRNVTGKVNKARLRDLYLEQAGEMA